MPDIRENISLKKFNTFGVDAIARYFVTLGSTGEILDFLNSSYSEIHNRLILGEGSNILFTKDFDGIVVRPAIMGINPVKETRDHVYLKVGAGENWDSFVNYCVEHNWGGLENLSLIPGSAGSSPIQNIGAYGVEVKDLIESVETIEYAGKKTVTFKNDECKFGYRDSIFKQKLKNRNIITYVTFRLDKVHRYITHYGNIRKELDKYRETSIRNIREIIINTRRNKLPDPKLLGNGGSFFKNPILSKETLESIRQFYPRIPYWEAGRDQFKISAAWLIEQCHWNKKRIGEVGTYVKHPLVIVNYGNATGKNILEIARKIQKTVKNNFAIHLEPEVNIL